MNITTPILKQLSLEISHGNPWWGLVVANEYLSAGSPLHNALAHHFLRRVEAAGGDLKRLAEKLIAGARYNELTPSLQSKVGKRDYSVRRRAEPCLLTTQHLSRRRAYRALSRLRKYEATSQLPLQRR